MQSRFVIVGLAITFCSGTCALRAADSDLKSLAAVGDDNARAAGIVQRLQADPSIKLMDVLSAMRDQSATTKNWYLSVAQTIADRNPQRSKSELEQFLPRLSEDSTARYWAFNFVTRGDQKYREQILESMLADPCLELRYDAVDLGLSRIKADESLSESQRIAAYRELLFAARLPSQIQDVAAKLEELGEEVDLLNHFGFIKTWELVGTFENKNQASFNVQYDPEKDYEAGKLVANSGSASWQQATTESADGAIDLNALYDNAKGVIVYGLSSFQSANELDCEVRLGSPNACQVWVNGQKVISREVYHSGNQIDQYVAPVRLRRGENSILVKICQNEQKEPWAQDWQFQLRFTDASGLAVR